MTTTVVTTTTEAEITTTIAESTEATEEVSRVTFTTPDLGGNNNYVQETVPPQQTYTETAPVIEENNSGEYGIESTEAPPVQTVTEAPAEEATVPQETVDPNEPPLAPGCAGSDNSCKSYGRSGCLESSGSTYNGSS